MITFLRKIRRQLLSQNKVSKYLLYAIGEIVLVVIGILIALQINNWNDWRKDRAKEKILLQDMAENLGLNIQNLKDDIEFLRAMNRSSTIVLEAMGNKIPFSDSLPAHFHRARVSKQNLSLSNIAYQALKSHGIDIITNKDLGKEILKLHEVTVPNSLSTNSLVNEEYQPFVNHIVLHFDLVQGEGLTPHDYGSLFTDHFYISWTKAYGQGRLYLIETDYILIAQYQKVLELILEELGRTD
jgi:hypothetical protein